VRKPVNRRGLGDLYRRFLEMPVPVLLAVLWLTGTAIFVACGLLLYVLVDALGRA
jgi:hypothetical protein